MINYAIYLDPISVREKAVSIVAPYSNGAGWYWKQPAAIFDYIKENINYVPDPVGGDHFAPPKQTLDSKGGDCDDQSILFTSMCIAVGIPARLVRCSSKSGEGHIFSEISYGQSNFQKVAKDLLDHYEFDFDEPVFHYEIDKEGLWVIADTTTGQYFGDLDGLERTEYVTLNRNNWIWRWINTPSYHEPVIKEVTIRFFEGGHECPPFEQRKYKENFPSKSVQYIYFELFMRIKQPSVSTSWKLHTKWMRSDGSTFCTSELQNTIESDWHTVYPYQGWGNVNGKAWQPGRYKVELFIESDFLENKKFSGEFEVY